MLTFLMIGCFEMDSPRDVAGNFAVSFVDNLRVYIGDELVAEARSGEDATVEWDGESFQISTLCGDEGVDCPSETFPAAVAVDQPWGPEYQLLNFVNLDPERGEPGSRIGGLLEADGAFSMLSGLAVGGEGSCAAIGIGTVEGTFSADNLAVDAGVIAFEWGAGCVIDEVAIGSSLRLETDFSALRTGDYDVSSVNAEEPIDEEGEVIDPEEPEAEYAVEY